MVCHKVTPMGCDADGVASINDENGIDGSGCGETHGHVKDGKVDGLGSGRGLMLCCWGRIKSKYVNNIAWIAVPEEIIYHCG